MLLLESASELHREERRGDDRQEGPIFVDPRNVPEFERGSVIAAVPVSEYAKRKP
jgi:hypothetical protein